MYQFVSIPFICKLTTNTRSNKMDHFSPIMIEISMELQPEMTQILKISKRKEFNAER